MNKSKFNEPDESIDCVFQDGSYPCGNMASPDCELCKRVATFKDTECQKGIERIIRDLEAIDRDAYDVRDFTRRVCDLIVQERQALKKQGIE